MKSKNPRVFSGAAHYNKFDVGVGQLETAIRLFLTDGCDMFSAITLAGSAGEIFHHLVVRGGKKPFVDDIAKIEQKRNPSRTPSRSKIIKHINATLFINEVKHFDDRNDEFIEFDAEECATGAILKAIADYKTLTGEESAPMKAFLGWTYKNLDAESIMERGSQLEKEFGE
jgi:hypothetical protein